MLMSSIEKKEKIIKYITSLDFHSFPFLNYFITNIYVEKNVLYLIGDRMRIL